MSFFLEPGARRTQGDARRLDPSRIGRVPVPVVERRGGIRGPILERGRRHPPNDPAAADEHAGRANHGRRHLHHQLNQRVARQNGLRLEEHPGVADIFGLPVPPCGFADRPVPQADVDLMAWRTRNVRSLRRHARPSINVRLQFWYSLVRARTGANRVGRSTRLRGGGYLPSWQRSFPGFLAR